MSQESVIGSIIFIIYVIDIDEGLTSKISTFADDTNITSKMNTTAEKMKLQSNLDILVSWSEKCQMKRTPIS